MRILTTIALAFLPLLIYGQGGSLTPNNPPGPTMRSLQEIWDKLVALETIQSNTAQKVSDLNVKIDALSSASNISFKWLTTTIDSNVSTGYTPRLRHNLAGELTVLYSKGSSLYTARQSQGAWISESVGVGTAGRADFGYASENAVLVVKQNLTGLVAILKSHTGETTEDVIDSTATDGSSVTSNPSLIVSPSQDVLAAIAYHNSSEQKLKYAEKSANGWQIVDIASGFTLQGPMPFLCIGNNGEPIITFVDASRKTLMLATRVQNSWTFSTVYTAASSIRDPSMIKDANGNLAISALDNGNLAYFHYNGSGYVRTQLSTGSNINNTTNIKLGQLGLPIILVNNQYSVLSSDGWVSYLFPGTENTVYGASNARDSRLEIDSTQRPVAIWYGNNNTLLFSVRTLVAN